jgi:hypothetical protein
MPYSIGKKTRAIAFVSVLAALHIILSIPPGPVGFRRPSIVLEPLEGMIGGPVLGFMAATVGWIGGRVVRPEGFPIENFFGFAEGMGALAAGFLAKKRWWVVAIVYGAMLVAFVVSPFARQIPLWTLWDTYLGFAAIFPAARIIEKTDFKLARAKSLVPSMALVTFVAVELDAMTRLFMLADLGLYQVYGLPAGAWYTIFIAGAFQTPIEAVFSVLVASAVGAPILSALRSSKLLDWPIS